MSKAKLPSKKKVDEVVQEVVQDEVITPVDADEVQDNVATTDAVYVDPFDFVYEVQAGKKFTGFSADEAVKFAHVMIGKVDKIVISKQK